MSVQQKQNFTHMDTDTELRFTQPGAYRYALNCRVGSTSGGNVGAVENVKGNTLIEVELPAGNNTVVGSFEDRKTNSCFYFLYNSNLDHGIYRYFTETNTVTKIFEWSGLNFQLDKFICHAGFLNNTLFWTDGFNPPRALDVNNVANFDTPYTEEYISLIKRPPNLPPTIVATGNDLTQRNNYIRDKQFQFRTQFIFVDNSVSTLSPISAIAYGTPSFTGKKTKVPRVLVNIRSFVGNPFVADSVDSYDEYVSQDNYIDVQLNIADFLSSPFGKMIKRVNIMFREGNTGKFGIFRTLSFTEASALIGDTIRFYNNAAVNIISDKDDAKLSDSVPLKSAALALMKNRVFLGNNTEGYNKVNPITFTVTQTLSTFIPGFLGDKIFKNRGKYNIGIVFYDKYMRSSGVILSTPTTNANTSSTVVIDAGKIQSYTSGGVFNQNGCTALTVTLPNNYTIPDWAYYYSIVRTPNIDFNFFQRVALSRIKYLERYDDNGNPIYNNGFVDTAIEVHIFFDAGTPSSVFYNFTEGDVLYMEYQNISGSNLESAQFPVRGLIYSDDDLNTSVKIVTGTVRGLPVTTNEVINQQKGLAGFIVSMEDYLRTGLPGSSVKILYGAEVMSPTVNAGLYYETGEILPITNPGEISAQFSSLSVTLEGDVYQTMRNFYVKPINSDDTFIVRLPTESYSIYNRDYETNANDIGRVNVVVEDERQQQEQGAIRFGNQFIQDSDINGLSSFDTPDKDTLTNDYGSLNKLHVAANNQSEGNVMLAIFKNAIASIYIGEAQIKDNAGTKLLTQTDNVIGGWNILRGEWGTSNPESIVEEDSVVYGWDVSKGVVWRYAQNGLTPISDVKRKFYFYDKSRALLSSTKNVALGTFDPFNNEYLLTFKDDTTEETVAFSEFMKAWTTNYSFIPEWFDRINTRLLSFKDGALWLHGENALYNNFYGVQYDSSITGICNIDASKQKILQNVSVESQDIWVATQITTPEGQESSLMESDYVHLTNAFSANVLRDINTPNVTYPILQGDWIRSSVFLVKMTNDKTFLSPLYFANYKVIGSERSNN